MIYEIGTKVFKPSGKPFKSGKKVNTISGVVDHPYKPGAKAYTFDEDDSVVSVEMCREYTDE